MLDTLLAHGLELAAAALVAVATPFLVKLLKNLASKYHIQVDIINQQKLEAFILQQILRVKEEVATAIKNKADIPSADAKLESVITRVLDKFPGVDEQEATDLTHALLQTVGEGAQHLSQSVMQQLQLVDFPPVKKGN